MYPGAEFLSWPVALQLTKGRLEPEPILLVIADTLLVSNHERVGLSEPVVSESCAGQVSNDMDGCVSMVEQGPVWRSGPFVAICLCSFAGKLPSYLLGILVCTLVVTHFFTHSHIQLTVEHVNVDSLFVLGSYVLVYLVG